MTDIRPFSVVVRLNNLPPEAPCSDLCNELKRLALLFDRIYYHRPRFRALKESYGNKVTFREDGGPSLPPIDYFLDTERNIEVLSTNRELNETIECFREAGIAEPIPFTREVDAEGYGLSDRIFQFDFVDAEFNELCGAVSEDYSSQPMLGQTVRIVEDSGVEHFFTTIKDPPSARLSYETSEIAYSAQQLSASPLYLNRCHRSVMQFRLKRYREGLDVLREAGYGPAVEGWKASLGEIAFQVSNSLFSSELVGQKRAEDIVKVIVQGVS